MFWLPNVGHVIILQTDYFRPRPFEKKKKNQEKPSIPSFYPNGVTFLVLKTLIDKQIHCLKGTKFLGVQDKWLLFGMDAKNSWHNTPEKEDIF